VKGLLAVMRGLPEHSVHERKQILESLDYLVRRCFLRNQPGKVATPPPLPTPAPPPNPIVGYLGQSTLHGFCVLHATCQEHDE